MSLLDRGTETVTVYPEVLVIDDDGNHVTKPGSVGVVCRAVVQPVSKWQSGSADDSGGTVPSRYRLRLVGYPDLLGAQSAVDWNGKRYAIDGDPQVYTGSPRTARAEYVMVRK